jgi:hypothetical protein
MKWRARGAPVNALTPSAATACYAAIAMTSNLQQMVEQLTQRIHSGVRMIAEASLSIQ